MTLIVERAQQVAADLAHAKSRRAFLSALQHFERLLTMAPDYPPGCLVEADGAMLTALADTVIGRVEQRLDRHTDRPAVQRSLAATIYQIRNDLESLYQSVRHAPPVR
jgi:hypothetical protein